MVVLISKLLLPIDLCPDNNLKLFSLSSVNICRSCNDKQTMFLLFRPAAYRGEQK